MTTWHAIVGVHLENDILLKLKNYSGPNLWQLKAHCQRNGKVTLLSSIPLGR